MGKISAAADAIDSFTLMFLEKKISQCILGDAQYAFGADIYWPHASFLIHLGIQEQSIKGLISLHESNIMTDTFLSSFLLKVGLTSFLLLI